MNRILRIVPAVALVTVATLSSAFAFAETKTGTSGNAATFVKQHGNGTTVSVSGNTRVIKPYGKHAQSVVQTRDDKGRWMPAGIAKIVRFKNGTTVSQNHDGTRTVQPYGKHAQPLQQQRGSDGRWMKAVASKVWGHR